MLNREAASSKNRPHDVIEHLPVREGCSIADIGAGGGYFTVELAKKVGRTGKVYAVDVKPKYLAFVGDEAKRANLDNIVPVLAADEMSLPAMGLDLLFVRNTYHHLHDPTKYFLNLRRFLKPHGKVAIIEHKPKRGFSFVALFKHHTTATAILREMDEAGFVPVQSFDFLPTQTFNLFEVREAP